MTGGIDPGDLVGAKDIAERLGVAHVETVHKWRQRYEDFPAPVRQLGRIHIWRWSDVEAWARRTGRLT